MTKTNLDMGAVGKNKKGRSALESESYIREVMVDRGLNEEGWDGRNL